MRIYIIGNDGITLCREASATVNDGEIAVASNEELHAASLSGAHSDDVGRAFRLMSATCSDGTRPAVPIDVGRGGGAPAGRV